MEPKEANGIARKVACFGMRLRALSCCIQTNMAFTELQPSTLAFSHWLGLAACPHACGLCVRSRCPKTSSCSDQQCETTCLTPMVKAIADKRERERERERELGAKEDWQKCMHLANQTTKLKHKLCIVSGARAVPRAEQTAFAFDFASILLVFMLPIRFTKRGLHPTPSLSLLFSSAMLSRVLAFFHAIPFYS